MNITKIELPVYIRSENHINIIQDAFSDTQFQMRLILLRLSKKAGFPNFKRLILKYLYWEIYYPLERISSNRRYAFPQGTSYKNIFILALRKQLRILTDKRNQIIKNNNITAKSIRECTSLNKRCMKPRESILHWCELNSYKSKILINILVMNTDISKYAKFISRCERYLYKIGIIKNLTN